MPLELNFGDTVYTGKPADYPRGYIRGAVSITKVRNAVKKRGFEIVNGHNSRVNNVLHGAFGFIKDPKSSRLIYFSTDDLTERSVLYRTAKHEKDWTGGTNRYAPLSQLAEECEKLFASYREGQPWGNPYAK